MSVPLSAAAAKTRVENACGGTGSDAVGFQRYHKPHSIRFDIHVIRSDLQNNASRNGTHPHMHAMEAYRDNGGALCPNLLHDLPGPFTLQ